MPERCMADLGPRPLVNAQRMPSTRASGIRPQDQASGLRAEPGIRALIAAALRAVEVEERPDVERLALPATVY